MKQQITRGIVLSRTDYGEADRIITILTPDHGKLRLMARGVRKVKSKLAGGIELFSVSQLTFIQGRGEVGTLISSRLERHYGQIVNDIARVQLGYDLIKQINKATEDHPEASYFEIMIEALAALDDPALPLNTVKIWFEASLLRLGGHTPNLSTDSNGNKLQPGASYNFDIEDMTFSPHSKGSFRTEHIKSLRLIFSGQTPAKLRQVEGLEPVIPPLEPLVRAMLTSYIRV